MQEKEISQAVIRRMPRYYRYLGELLEDGVERISSNDLSKRMNVTASQIRQDLNNFGGFGQQGYGYNVKFLYEEIGKILGLNQKHNIIVIGAGNLGQALANYVKFEKLGFVITALFDVNPALEGVTVRGIKIHTARITLLILQPLPCRRRRLMPLQTVWSILEFRQSGILPMWTLI